jgi:hypothetical protein
MGRPSSPELPADEVEVPAWVLTYVQADWERPEDDTCWIAVENNSPEFARLIEAAVRYSAARREWYGAHGLSRDEFYALVKRRSPGGARSS